MPSGGSVFADLLRSEVFDGTNYMDWKQRVDMLLSYYGFKDIICVKQAPILPQLPSSENGEIIANIKENYEKDLKKYQDWKIANDITKSYVLSSLNKTLRMTYFHTQTTKEILDKLESKYGKQSDSHVNNLWKKFTKGKCEEGADVRKHVNEMVAIADELKFCERNMDEKTIIPTIINSLPESYKFIEDFYTLSEFDWTVGYLINKINHQEDRKLMRKPKETLKPQTLVNNVELKPKKKVFKKK